MNALEQLLSERGRSDPALPSPIIIPGMKRKHLGHLFRDFGFKLGVEVGVEGGLYSDALLSCNPGLCLYGVDVWTAYEDYRQHVTKEIYEGFYENVLKIQVKHGLNRFRLLKMWSMDAIREFLPNSLDFVYIDGNHNFDFVMQDIIEWSKRVKPGGIVAGHDFTRRNLHGEGCAVVPAVQTYVACHGIKRWYLTESTRYEQLPSFFWVKP